MHTRPLCLALLAAAGLAGCGGGGGSTTSTAPPAPATALARALAPVLDGPTARAGLVYSDEAALRRLAHAPSSVTRLGTTQLDQRWFGLVGFGAPAFVAAAPQLPRPTGIDLFAADRAVTVGAPPRTATRLDGARLDTSSIGAALRRLGARRAGTVLALGAEGAAHLSGPLGSIGIVTALDRVVARPGLIAAGPYASDVSAVLGGGPSVTTDAPWAKAVRCLGDVVAASIAPNRGRLLALGVVRPAPHPRSVTERLCLVGNIDVDGIVRSLRGESARTRLPATVQAISAEPVERGTVRATLTLDPREPAGLLFRLAASHALGALLG
jgi:hypothetical protein